MNRNNWLVAAAVAAFLVSFVALLPAHVALRWLVPPGVTISGASGNIWRGTAVSAEFGRVRLGETSWRLSAFPLILGRLAADLETRLGDSRISGSVRLGLSGDIACTTCRFEGPLASLVTVFPALSTLDGRLALDLARLEIRAGWPVRAVGAARLTGVPLNAPSGARNPQAPRSDLEASVSADPVPADGVIEIAVQDSGGPMQLTARLVLTPPGSFEFSGNAKARPDAPAEISRALSTLGRKAPDGSTELGLAGTF